MKILSRSSSINIMLFLALLILTGTSIFTYFKMQQLIAANKMVVHTHQVIEEANEAMLLITDLESKASLYLLTKDKYHIENIPYLVSQLYDSINRLKILTKDNPRQQKNITIFMGLVKEKLNLMYKIVDYNLKSKTTVISEEDSVKRVKIKNEIYDISSTIIDYEVKLLGERTDVSIRTAQRSNLMLISASILSEVLFLLSIVLLNYYLYQRNIIEEKQLQTEQELAKKNKKLRTIQKRYHLAVKGSNTGLWDWKIGSEKVYYSNNFRKLLGYDKNEFPNLFSSFENKLYSEDHDRVFSEVKKHLEKGKPYKVEYRLKNKTGEYRWYQAVGEATKDKNGNPVRMSGFLIDISERKHIEMMKNEFISIVSHELRTPLTSIHGAISLLTSTEFSHLSEDANQLLNIAKTNSERLIRLINDILDIEKIESGRMQFNLTVMEMNNIVKEAIATNQAYADKFSVKLSLSNNIPEAYIKADHDRLIQVLTNLISNAIKYSPRDETVMLDVAIIDKDKVRVSVIDKGDGIPKKFQSIIFQKFSQADSSTTRKREGTGLGLNITKNIIETLGGSINFITDKNGTTFYFDLPMVELSNKNTVFTIIIDIKNNNTIDLFKGLFEKNNFNVKIVNLTSDIVNIIQHTKIDAIILDLSDIESVSLIKKIRSQVEYNTIPIAIIATNDNVSNKELIMNAVNIIDWIDESADKDRLLQAVDILKKDIRSKAINVLHVEDDTDLAKVVKSILNEQAKTLNVQTIKEARYELLNNDYDLVILDLKLPDGFSVELLPILNKKNIPVIIFTAYELPNEYIYHVSQILTKSKTSNEELVATIKKIIKNSIHKGEHKNETA